MANKSGANTLFEAHLCRKWVTFTLQNIARNEAKQ
jgi:hypothetical protein